MCLSQTPSLQAWHPGIGVCPQSSATIISAAPRIGRPGFEPLSSRNELCDLAQVSKPLCALYNSLLQQIPIEYKLPGPVLGARAPARTMQTRS